MINLIICVIIVG